MRHSIQRLHQVCGSFQKNLLITHTHTHTQFSPILQLWYCKSARFASINSVCVQKRETKHVMRRTEKEAVGISFTPTCHTHTHTQIHTEHTLNLCQITQAVIQGCDPFRLYTYAPLSFFTRRVWLCVCVCACYPVVFLCKSHISSGPQTHSDLTKSTKTKTGHEHLTTASYA